MNETVSGMVAGGVSTIIGHPLDTIKTWKQNSIFTNRKLQQRISLKISKQRSQSLTRPNEIEGKFQ